MSESASAHSYEEPQINSVLILSSFLLLLNFVGSVLNSIIHCGLLGQILVGVAWGTPGAKWLNSNEETAVSQLGYIGLLLLVYEGGLSTSFASLRANLAVSTGVAITGIVAPIGLSFILHSFLGASYLQCFAAGAALCSTSLGTTFTVLSSTGLTKTRLGVVLTSAAMMDDVVGLVMVEVISKLGSGESLGAVTLLRPIMTSIGFAVLVPLICWLVLRPIAQRWSKHREMQPLGPFLRFISNQKASLVIQILVLVGMSAAGSYAGTSNLFTAYIAGACITWWDSEVSKASIDGPESEHRGGTQLSHPRRGVSGIENYREYLQQANNKFLAPFFFASIGFSIPISTMFSGPVVWKGLVYACLMAFGKLLCGLWLLPIASLLGLPERPKTGSVSLTKVFHLKSDPASSSNKPRDKDIVKANLKEHDPKAREPKEPDLAPTSNEAKDQDDMQTNPLKHDPKTPGPQASDPASTSTNVSKNQDTVQITPKSQSLKTPETKDTNPPLTEVIKNPNTRPSHKQPLSIYPSAILGSAMVARGEIGFLISALAQSRGIFTSNSSPQSEERNPDLFLIVTWAIMLCTILGPIAVGVLVRRIRMLDRARDGTAEESEGLRDVMGDWGI